jgi:hypothetical protein
MVIKMGKVEFEFIQREYPDIYFELFCEFEYFDMDDPDMN